jgi:hypothetical protein
MARVNSHASAELIDIRLLRCFDALRADRSVSLRRMCFPSGRFAWSYRSRQAVRSTPLRARLRSTGHRSSINRSSSTIAAALPERSARSSSLAAPDGYTLLYGNAGPLSIGPNLQDKVPYDIFKDFAPVSLVVTSLFLIFASTALPKNVHELIAYAKARPGQLNYASSGMGQRAASCRRALQQRGRDRHRARAVRDELMNREDCEAVTSSPEELAKVLREDYAKWGKLIRTIGVKVN